MPHGSGQPGDGGHQLGVHHVLQSAPVFLRQGRCAGNHQHRSAGHMRIGDAGHGVGDTRPGSDQGHAQRAGQLGLGMRHVHRGAFVPHVDDLNAMRVQRHPYGHDVAAAQTVNPCHTLAFDKSGNHIGHLLAVSQRGLGSHREVLFLR